MNKTWTTKKKGEDKIIGLGNDMIFKANPKKEELFKYTNDIEKNIISDAVLRIPYSYLKTIRLQEGKKYIQVFFGKDSEEHLRIKNKSRRKEIFNYFKENIPRTAYSFEKYSALKAGKKPIIAIALVSVLFILILYFAIQIENGVENKLEGSGLSLIGFFYAFASIGTTKVVTIFGSLFTIALLSMINKMKNRPEVHEITIVR